MKLIFVRNIKYKLKTMWMKLNCKMYYGNQIHFGKQFCSRGNVNICIDEEGKIDIGDNVFINCGTSINSICSVKIGNDCMLGENVHIYDHNHNYKDITQLIREQGFSKAEVIIGNNCWICSNVIILKGVTIGNNVVIGAGCIVRKDVPDNAIVHSDGKIIVNME